jgi:hypothetical protein
MRQKVAYSQQVLVRITLEDYGLIANNAEKLVELSNKTSATSGTRRALDPPTLAK